MVNKVLRYVRGTTGLMLTYRKSDYLEIEGYSDQTLQEMRMIENPRLDISSLLQRERYRGKAPSSQSQHHPRCMLNL